MQKNVYVLCATCGRNTLLARSIACFLGQDYEGEHTMLIHNNSEVPIDYLNLPAPPPDNKHIVIVNQHLSSSSNKSYTSLGEIYNDTITHVPITCEVISHWDDDDLFLPNHITEGIKGLEEGGKSAYKPQFSWFRHGLGIELMNNTLEPSMFVKAQHIKTVGYSPTTTDQHLHWLHPLLAAHDIFVKLDGVPTLIYNWGDETPTFKTSGNAGDPNNFNNYRRFSHDHSSKGIITPISGEELEKQYFNKVPIWQHKS